MVVAVAIVTPPALVVTGFRVLANDWFVRFEYDRAGFPDDRYGLTRGQRERLALLGLESIRPGGAGVMLLERASLPDGSTAFESREVAHMRDVRVLLRVVLAFQLVVAITIALLALGLARTRARALVARGLLLGASATIGIALLCIPLILLGFDEFFVRFHELAFEGDSWQFSRTDTLLRLYPERFWEDTVQLVAAFTVAQAVLLAALAWFWLGRLRRGVAS